MKKLCHIVFLVFLLALTFLIVATLSCGDDDDDDDTGSVDDDDAADDDDDTTDDDDDATDDDDDVVDDDDDDGQWWPPAAGTEWVFRFEAYEKLTFDLTAVVVGPEEIYDGTWTRVEIGDFTQADPEGLVWWLDLSTVDQFGYKALEAYVSGLGKGGEPFYTVVFDDPIVLPTAGEIGVPFESYAEGQMFFDGYPIDFWARVTSTIESTTETVTVPYGTLDGCTYISAVVEQSDMLDPENVEYWFHNDVGPVKATSPPGYVGAELVSFTPPAI